MLAHRRTVPGFIGRVAPWQRVTFVEAQSPYESSADFAKYAMKLRAQALLKVEPQVFVPTTSRFSSSRYPWKTDIVTTVFWIGEHADREQSRSESQEFLGLATGRAITAVTTAPIPHGGTTTSRSISSRGRIRFTVALPYNDVTHGQFKPEARDWSFRGFDRHSCSRGIRFAKIAGSRSAEAIGSATRNGKIVGRSAPTISNTFSRTNARRPNLNHGAGLDVSPAVRDYLGLRTDVLTDWQFVEVRDVPPGPWRNYGDNNHFVIARRQTEQRLAEQETTKTKTKK